MSRNLSIVTVPDNQAFQYCELKGEMATINGSIIGVGCYLSEVPLLAHIGTTTPLEDAVLVADNAPCHINIEDVFAEDEFFAAKLLRLGLKLVHAEPHRELLFSAQGNGETVPGKSPRGRPTSPFAPYDQGASQRVHNGGGGPAYLRRKYPQLCRKCTLHTRVAKSPIIFSRRVGFICTMGFGF